jgi:hypothetical protein
LLCEQRSPLRVLTWIKDADCDPVVGLWAIRRGSVSGLYFFTIQVSDRRVTADPHGTNLLNDADALSCAERTITELCHEPRYENPQLMMIVQDEDRHLVWSLPFLPACA